MWHTTISFGRNKYVDFDLPLFIRRFIPVKMRLVSVPQAKGPDILSSHLETNGTLDGPGGSVSSKSL